MTEAPADFQPFETARPGARAGDPARRRGGRDDGELFLERRRSEALVFDDGRVRSPATTPARGSGCAP
jgi:TldD protein